MEEYNTNPFDTLTTFLPEGSILSPFFILPSQTSPSPPPKNLYTFIQSQLMNAELITTTPTPLPHYPSLFSVLVFNRMTRQLSWPEVWVIKKKILLNNPMKCRFILAYQK